MSSVSVTSMQIGTHSEIFSTRHLDNRFEIEQADWTMSTNQNIRLKHQNQKTAFCENQVSCKPNPELTAYVEVDGRNERLITLNSLVHGTERAWR